MPQDPGRDALSILVVSALVWGPELLVWLAGDRVPAMMGQLAMFLSLPAGAIFAMVVARRSGGLEEVGIRGGTSPWRTLIFGLLSGLGMLLLARYVINPVVFGTLGPWLDPAPLDPLKGDVVRLLINVVVVSWLSAALCEEIVFRGFLLRWLERVLGISGWTLPIAVLLQGVGFGLAHLGQGVSAFAATAVGGVFWGLLYVAGGRELWRLIIAHGVFDTTLFLLVFLGEHRWFLPD